MKKSEKTTGKENLKRSAEARLTARKSTNSKMYKKPPTTRSTIRRNKSVEGETIEQKMERIINNKEPIKDGAPQIFTERSEGVKAAYNIRTDRFEVAIDAMDKVQKSYTARREDRAKKGEGKDKNNEENGEPKPTQGKPTGGGTDENLNVK